MEGLAPHSEASVGAGAPRARRPAASFELTLRVPAEVASLAVVRHALGGAAAALGRGPAEVSDVRLAVTEACSAAIRRLEGRSGWLDVRADVRDGAMHVRVSDSGDVDVFDDGLPLPLMAAITDSVELIRHPSGGTEVAMAFAIGP